MNVIEKHLTLSGSGTLERLNKLSVGFNCKQNNFPKMIAYRDKLAMRASVLVARTTMVDLNVCRIIGYSHYLAMALLLINYSAQI